MLGRAPALPLNTTLVYFADLDKKGLSEDANQAGARSALLRLTPSLLAAYSSPNFSMNAQVLSTV
jgi:hypothetical protein